METLFPILVFIVAASAVGFLMLGIGGVIGPKRDSAVKEMPYESGMDPIHDARRRFDVRFHLVAIAFLIFDVELLFLYPWAVASHKDNSAGLQKLFDESAASGVSFSRTLVFGEVMLFMVLLTLGFVYAWRKGVFRWR